MEKKIDSVGIVIHTTDNQTKEIPLEIWQLEVFTLILGLQVNLSNLDEYTMSNRESYEEAMALYKDAVRERNRKW